MLNNFTRLEPSLRLLGIPFSATTVQELMQEKQGVAAHIVHQLYMSLELKKKADISGTMMKAMQPTAVTTLRKKEREIYCDVSEQKWVVQNQEKSEIRPELCVCLFSGCTK